MIKIAILLTSYNRKDKTLQCLRSVREQEAISDITLEIFLTDDKSSDGTSTIVKELFPEVKIFHGTGSLFWAGGMRNSWRHALSTDPDYYLLLNDDTILYNKAIYTLLQSSRYASQKFSKPAICVGSTNDNLGKVSYGGRKLIHKIRPNSFIVYSETENLECDLGNANIMLIPQEIVKKIGILSNAYTHGIADYDYTLRAKKAGFPIIISPGILGGCTDDHGNNWKSQKNKLKERIQYLYSPKGLAYKEYIFFIRNHFPLHLPEAMFKLWLKTIFPFLWDSLKNEKS